MDYHKSAQTSMSPPPIQPIGVVAQQGVRETMEDLSRIYERLCTVADTLLGSTPANAVNPSSLASGLPSGLLPSIESFNDSSRSTLSQIRATITHIENALNITN